MAVVAILIVVGLAAVVLGAGGIAIVASGSKLSAQDIAGYAANAGFSGPDLQVAVAVALAESGGDPNIVGDQNITPGGSVGLWQINLRWHPEYTADMLRDPQTNANAAYQIYMAAGQQFTDWSTYKTGAYSAYIVQAQQGVNA